MFFTIGIIIELFKAGWFVNDKWDWVNLKQFFGRNNMLGIRLFLIGILRVVGGVYVMKLRSDNVTF